MKYSYIAKWRPFFSVSEKLFFPANLVKILKIPDNFINVNNPVHCAICCVLDSTNHISL